MLVMAVALGGAVGAVGRYTITHLTQQRLVTHFPVGTLLANLIGCLAIGFLYIWFQQRIGHEGLRAGLQIGLIGALTTFSTYALESIKLFNDERYAYAAANLIGSVVLGLAAAWAGMVLAKSIVGVAP